jgi:hypothetical protein
MKTPKIQTVAVDATNGSAFCHLSEGTPAMRFTADEIGSVTSTANLVVRCQALADARIAALADTLPAKLAELADVEQQISAKRADLDALNASLATVSTKVSK